MKKLLYILILIPGIASQLFAEGRDSCNCTRANFIQISSAPYTISTADTCYALSDNLSSATTGITVNADSIYLTMAGYDITYNTGDGDGNHGIIINAPGGANKKLITIKGNPASVVQYGGDATTGSDNFGIYIHGTINMLLDSVNVIAGGHDGKALQCMAEASPRKIDSLFIRGGHYSNGSRNYTGRQTYDASVFHFSSPGYADNSPSVINRDYDIKMVGVHIDSGYNVGAVTSGSAVVPIPDRCGIIQIEACTTHTDTRNFEYEWGVCTCTPYSPCDIGYSSVNSYPFLLTYIRQGSYIKDCYIEAGTDYLGAPGISFECAVGTSSDTLKCWGNTIYGHQGPKGEGSSIYGNICSLIRQRAIDGGATGYVHFKDNHSLLTVDSGACGEDDITPAYGIGGDACWLSLQYSDDSGHLLIENNTFEARIKEVSKAGGVTASAFSMGPITSGGFKNTVIRNNHYISDDIIVTFGRGFGCDSLLLEGDTLEFTDSSSANAGRVTYYLSGGESTINDVRVRDIVYIGGAADDDVEYGSAVSAEIFFEKTMQLTVNQSGSPVAAAVCSVWNNYNYLIWTGSTNESGIASGVVTYRYDSYAGDSTGYNPFTIKAIKASDSVVADSSVVWNDAEYILTLPGEGGVTGYQKVDGPTIKGAKMQ